MIVTFIFEKGIGHEGTKSHEIKLDREKVDSFKLQDARGGEQRVRIPLTKAQAERIEGWLEGGEWFFYRAKFDGHEREIREYNFHTNRKRFIEFGGC